MTLRTNVSMPLNFRSMNLKSSKMSEELRQQFNATNNNSQITPKEKEHITNVLSTPLNFRSMNLKPSKMGEEPRKQFNATNNNSQITPKEKANITQIVCRNNDIIPILYSTAIPRYS